MYDKNTWRIFSSLHARSRYAATIDRHGEPMERKLIQFAFPGKEEGNRSRKIIFQGEKKKKERKRKVVFEIVSNLFRACRLKLRNHKCKVQSYKVQEKRNGCGYNSPVYDRKRARVFFHAVFEKSG